MALADVPHSRISLYKEALIIANAWFVESILSSSNIV